MESINYQKLFEECDILKEYVRNLNNTQNIENVALLNAKIGRIKFSLINSLLTLSDKKNEDIEALVTSAKINDTFSEIKIYECGDKVAQSIKPTYQSELRVANKYEALLESCATLKHYACSLQTLKAHKNSLNIQKKILYFNSKIQETEFFLFAASLMLSEHEDVDAVSVCAQIKKTLQEIKIINNTSIDAADITNSNSLSELPKIKKTKKQHKIDEVVTKKAKIEQVEEVQVTKSDACDYQYHTSATDEYYKMINDIGNNDWL